VLASVHTSTDPIDVMFVHSTDGGQTWSAPTRVNDDPVGNHAFHWFGTMSVAPNGRIDVVWNDTRGSADSSKSALRYSSSNDGGATWSPSVQASPVWDSSVGWPKQRKIGDYYHMISRDDGADLAWAATLNGEEDIYYLHIAPPSIAMTRGGAAPTSTLSAMNVGDQFNLRSTSRNPFASATTIHFDVPAAGAHVKLEVFDAVGRHVATLLDGWVSGPQTLRWTACDDGGRHMRSGLYLCRLAAADRSETLKLMLLR